MSIGIWNVGGLGWLRDGMVRIAAMVVTFVGSRDGRDGTGRMIPVVGKVGMVMGKLGVAGMERSCLMRSRSNHKVSNSARPIRSM